MTAAIYVANGAPSSGHALVNTGCRSLEGIIPEGIIPEVGQPPDTEGHIVEMIPLSLVLEIVHTDIVDDCSLDVDYLMTVHEVLIVLSAVVQY